MKRVPLLLLVLILIAVFCVSCKPKPPVKKKIQPTFSTLRTNSERLARGNEKSEIFYGLLTPVEITAIFSRLGVPYEKAALNPVANNDLYTSNAKAAVNLGIYGVDFGYIKMFSISQQMIDYIFTIKDMSNKLGIPDKYLMEPIKKLESNMSSPDTILALVNKSYTDIESHLRKEGRESTAGLMLMGGWVEALYLTTQLLYNAEKPDTEVVEKIAQQKYTLTSLLSFMKNYYDDPVVVYYTKKLIFLKRYFDKFDIYFKKGDLEINTSRQVLMASGSETTVTLETLTDIKNYVAKLRSEMVSP
ncbi:MAG: hypothetical protein C0408_07280 [Odoribacter sp.]|nr:hypothetical protein [Odoribacter sp.]